MLLYLHLIKSNIPTTVRVQSQQNSNVIEFHVYISLNNILLKKKNFCRAVSMHKQIQIFLFIFDFYC